MPPPNLKAERNAALLADLSTGMSVTDAAAAYGVTKQRVSELWRRAHPDRRERLCPRCGATVTTLKEHKPVCPGVRRRGSQGARNVEITVRFMRGRSLADLSAIYGVTSMTIYSAIMQVCQARNPAAYAALARPNGRVPSSVLKEHARDFGFAPDTKETPPAPPAVSLELGEIMGALRLTQAAFAERLGKTQGNLSLLLRGRRTPKAALLQKARALLMAVQKGAV